MKGTSGSIRSTKLTLIRWQKTQGGNNSMPAGLTGLEEGSSSLRHSRKERERLYKQLWFSCLLLHSEPHHENQVRQPVQSATAVWCLIQDKHGPQLVFPTNQSRSSEREKHFPGLTDEPGLEEKAIHSQVGQGILPPPDRDERT